MRKLDKIFIGVFLGIVIAITGIRIADMNDHSRIELNANERIHLLEKEVNKLIEKQEEAEKEIKELENWISAM